jgi:hypothetical protein
LTERKAIMATAKEQESTYPRTLLWEEDAEDLGDRRRISGRFVAIDEAPTSNGLKPILVLAIDGEERSVWVLHGPFQDKLTEELERRPNNEFTPGELIVVEQWKDKKIGEASGRPYVPYKARFPERPKRSQRDILGAQKQPSDVMDDAAATAGDADFGNVGDDNGADGDIPF